MGGAGRAGGRAGGGDGVVFAQIFARLLVWLGCSPLRKGLGMRKGLRKGLGMQAQRGRGLHGARACRGHSYRPRLLTASTRPARHPPLTFTPAFPHSTGLPSSHSTPRRVHSCPPARKLFKPFVVILRRPKSRHLRRPTALFVCLLCVLPRPGRLSYVGPPGPGECASLRVVGRSRYPEGWTAHENPFRGRSSVKGCLNRRA